VERQLKALRDVSGSNIAASLEEVRGAPLHLGWGLLALRGWAAGGWLGKSRARS